MTFRERKTMGVLRAAMSRVEGTARDVGGLLRTEFGSTASFLSVYSPRRGDLSFAIAVAHDSRGNCARVLFSHLQ